MPSSLRDEFWMRSDRLEREAQIIHLLCLNRQQSKAPASYESHIAEIAERLKRLIAHPPEPHLVEK